MATHRIYVAALTVLALLLLVHTSGAQDTEPKTRTMYVKVASSNPDAVIQSSTDFFEAETLGTLLQNQPVEMIEGVEDREYVKILARVDGKKVEGWVKASILQEQPLSNVPRVSDSGAIDNADFRWGSRFETSPELAMRKECRQMDRALKTVDELQTVLDPRHDDHEESDSTVSLRRYRDFAQDGGLRPGSSK